MGHDADPVITRPPVREIAHSHQVTAVEAAKESWGPVEGGFDPIAHPARLPKGIEGVSVSDGDLTTTSTCGRPIATSGDVPVPVRTDDLVDLVAEQRYEALAAKDVGNVASPQSELQRLDEVRGRRQAASVTPVEEEHTSIAGQVSRMRRDGYPRPPEVVG